MHCVSSYPCDIEKINMKRLLALKELSNTVGYSGHLSGIEDSILAITYGATYIEKHFTIDNDLPGRDNKISILPEELREIKKYILISKKLQKFKGFNFLKKEKIIRDVYSKRWVN